MATATAAPLDQTPGVGGIGHVTLADGGHAVFAATAAERDRQRQGIELVTGNGAEKALGPVGITLNKNAVRCTPSAAERLTPSVSGSPGACAPSPRVFRCLTDTLVWEPAGQ